MDDSVWRGKGFIPTDFHGNVAGGLFQAIFKLTTYAVFGIASIHSIWRLFRVKKISPGVNRLSNGAGKLIARMAMRLLPIMFMVPDGGVGGHAGVALLTMLLPGSEREVSPEESRGQVSSPSSQGEYRVRLRMALTKPRCRSEGKIAEPAP